MPYYRLYYVNGEGRICNFDEIVADEDRMAIEKAEELRGSAAAELWQQERMVCSFSADKTEQQG